MNASEIRCYYLAEEIEEIHARDLARQHPRWHRKTWKEYYDPHAATELGSLIYNRLRSQSTSGEQQ
jgi:hypothetical protein